MHRFGAGMCILLAVSGTAMAQTVNIATTSVLGSGSGCGVTTGPPAITNLPYTATIVHKFEQTLSDGTNIHREETTHVARDSQGRTMCENEVYPQTDPELPDFEQVSVGDPVAGTLIYWTTNNQVATLYHTPAQGAIMRSQPVGETSPARKLTPASSSATSTASATSGIGSGSGGTNHRVPRSSDPNRKFEQLGSKTIAGVAADGTRTTITIPIGKAGNDRPITTLQERWFCHELRIELLTLSNDPRVGNQSIEVIELNRSEPDAALFQVPAGYTVKDTNPPAE